MDVSHELKESFKNLVGLENQKNVDKLKALIDFWNGNFNPDDFTKEDDKPSINKQLAKLLPQINEETLLKEQKELKIMMDKALDRYKNSKPLDMQSYKANQKYWRDLLENKDIKRALEKVEKNLGEGIKEIITKSYIPMIEDDLKEFSKYPIELQLRIWRKALEMYSYQDGKQAYIQEVELFNSKKKKKQIKKASN